MAAADRRPRDVNSLAARVVAEATGQAEKTEAPDDSDQPPDPSDAVTLR